MHVLQYISNYLCNQINSEVKLEIPNMIINKQILFLCVSYAQNILNRNSRDSGLQLGK
jgi:hypothetical protein